MAAKNFAQVAYRFSDIKFPLALFCKSALPKADVVLSHLRAPDSQFLAMIQNNVIIHAKCQ